MAKSLTPALIAALSAVDARRMMTQGLMTAGEYTAALIAQVDSREPEVQAFAHIEPALWRAQADSCDDSHARGAVDGPLFGLPVGIKDIIDTADLPTENGTVLHVGRRPQVDATLVRLLRAAGGIVAGKTVTTELATYAPGKTRNPHNLAHTPGGSSSGSAAAVAAGMVPLAVGTQTNGSVIRPASFCGVVGYKPSAGLIARTGVLTQSPTLDCIGVFACTVGDVALLAQALAGHDPLDLHSLLRAVPPLVHTAASALPLPPTLAWVQTPFWDRVAPDAQAAFAQLLELLAGRVAPLELPVSASEAMTWHRTVMEAEIAGSFVIEYERGREQLSASLRSQIERGRTITAVDYRAAMDRVPCLLASMDKLLEHFDAILTPATLGTAPEGLDSTGDPLMCTLWSLLGMPAVSLPLLHGENGLPIGVQLVGRKGDDARLLRTAQWLMTTVQTATS